MSSYVVSASVTTVTFFDYGYRPLDSWVMIKRLL